MERGTTTRPASPTPTRRERLRAEITDQIIEIGRRQLEEGGVANVNWRGIAQEVGMNPASLYTYVDGIHDLYTRILGHSFARLADAVAAAARTHADDSGRDRLLACARAYRQWAVSTPNQFNLIFTDQIPGYEAPSEGPAFDAAMNVNLPFTDALADHVAELRARTAHSSGPESDGRAAVADLSAEQARLAYELRSMMHGFTTLEINHHAPYVNGSDDLMITALSRLLDAWTEDFGPRDRGN